MNSAVCRRALIVSGTVIVTASATAVGAAQAAPRHTAPRHPAVVRLEGSAAPAVRHAQVRGDASSAQPSSVQVWLKPDASTSAAAEDFARSVSTPGSAEFHHYLSPNDYTSRFAASSATAQATADWLRAQGYRSVAVDKYRNYVRASGTVADSQHAFDVRMKHYVVTDGSGRHQAITANDRAVALPASIAKNVVGVTGLDTVQPRNPLAQTATDIARTVAGLRTHKGRSTLRKGVKVAACSKYFGERIQTGVPSYHKSTHFFTALCGYTATQLRAAYGMTSANTGKGQTVAYVEIGAPYKMADTLRNWAKRNGLPASSSARYRQTVLGRGNKCGNPFDIEEQLDVEAGYAMAPAQNQLLVGGDGCAAKYEGAQALFDADLSVVNGNGTHPSATIVSNSWELGDEATPAAYSKVMHSILTRAAGEGVGMYFSSGDAPGVEIPSDDPFATAVGGTSLAINKANHRIFETGWSNKFLAVDERGRHYIDEAIGRSAAGGGTSLLWKQPSYQSGVVPTSMSSPKAGDVGGLRAVPDISALADPYTGINQGITVHDHEGDHYVTFPDGGTSLAAPLVAGMMAAAQEGQATPFGFANPLLYKLAGTSAVHDPLPVTNATAAKYRAVFCSSDNDLCGEDSLQTFDSQAHAYTDQETAVGYDTMTGIGTPNGQTFVDAVRGQAQSG